jgi:hypothetical protein
MNPSSILVAFDGPQRIATGAPTEIARKVSTYLRGKPEAQPLLFDLETGKQVDLDWRNPAAQTQKAAAAAPQRAGKGRPKLGVVAKEVTLLPRHWDWLARQPGGASVTLRKLIERASKDPAPAEKQRARAEAAYHFMHAVAGNLPGFEEASRLLFAGNTWGLSAAMGKWPGDIADQVLALVNGESPDPAA